MNTALQQQPMPANHLRVVGRRNYINKHAQLKPIEGVLFTDFIEQTINRKTRRVKDTSRKGYKTLMMHILGFEELHDCEIFTNSVNEEFLEDFLTYLESKDLSLNYIKHLLCITKSMVAKAQQYNYATDPTYKDVEIKGEASDNIFLSMNEITRIYYFDGLTKAEERVRDLFIVGCMTGLRYSDYSTLTSDNFDGDFIVKITQKTKAKVMVPLSKYVREIYNKYDGSISRGLSTQHFNRYIKQVCRKVGLDDEVKRNSTRGGRIVIETLKKWELVSSHTARRSAATNMYLSGYKPHVIMAITGHTTERSFFKYIKITQEDRVKSIAGDHFFNN